jgi:thiamine-phosphate pyrophosphorylase
MKTAVAQRITPFDRELYVVSDSTSVLESAIVAGAAIVQLRDKDADEEIILRKAEKLLALKNAYSFLLIINDDPRLAAKTGVDGVHVGQDASTPDARRIIGDSMILGKTTHGLDQAGTAVVDGADYVSVGPVYATPTKPGRTPVGLRYVREAAQHLTIPFVTIGGIDLSNIDEVLDAGATTIGIVRAWRDAAPLLERIRGRRG